MAQKQVTAHGKKGKTGSPLNAAVVDHQFSQAHRRAPTSKAARSTSRMAQMGMSQHTPIPFHS